MPVTSKSSFETIDTNNMAAISPEFEKFVQEKVEEWHVPGLSLAIVQGDDIHTSVRSFNLCIRPLTNFIAGIWLCNPSQQKGHYRNPLRPS
jgi:hypothetical protein